MFCYPAGRVRIAWKSRRWCLRCGRRRSQSGTRTRPLFSGESVFRSKSGNAIARALFTGVAPSVPRRPSDYFRRARAGRLRIAPPKNGVRADETTAAAACLRRSAVPLRAFRYVPAAITAGREVKDLFSRRPPFPSRKPVRLPLPFSFAYRRRRWQYLRASPSYLSSARTLSHFYYSLFTALTTGRPTSGRFPARHRASWARLVRNPRPLRARLCCDRTRPNWVAVSVYRLKILKISLPDFWRAQV